MIPDVTLIWVQHGTNGLADAFGGVERDASNGPWKGRI